MANVFLSPSTQDFNPVVIGGNEEQYANEITDLLEPQLRNLGINFSRNDRTKTVGQSIRDSNAGFYNLHLAIHSNAAPPNLSGQLRGIDVYYNQNSPIGKQVAELFANNLKNIYPDPERVRAVPTTTLVELNRTKAPAILLELGYHDNVEDATWLVNNTQRIADNLADSLRQIYIG